MAWFVYALATAITWGIGYALTEKLLHSGISSFLLLSLHTFISTLVFCSVLFFNGAAKQSFEILTSNSALIYIMLAAVLAFILGNVFIMQAIALKNATYANLIEITYPLFTILFTYLFFRNVHIDWTVAIGGVLILAGTSLIIYKGHS